MSQISEIMDDSSHREVYSALTSLEKLPASAKQTVNETLRNLLAEKRAALGKVKDLPGNTEAYYHIGMIFMWEMRRIDLAGTFEEKMASLTTVYQPKDGENVRGYASIAYHFLERYAALEPHGAFMQQAGPILATLRGIMNKSQ